MIGHVQTDEQEATAKRVICAHCRKAVIPHEETDRGSLCRKSVETATEIWVSWVIDGVTYRKKLKGKILAVEGGKSSTRKVGQP
jgi:hypothetical protein